MQTRINTLNAIEVLEKLISYPTITPQECGIYVYIKEILYDFEVLELDKEGVKNIFLYKDLSKLQNPSKDNPNTSNSNSCEDSKGLQENLAKPHLCFAGHIDVVPPGEGWESEPFTPITKGEFLYGRGAQDMKAGVSAFVCAIREFVDCVLARDFKESKENAILQNHDTNTQTQGFNGILSVLLTSDEEGAAIFGTKYVLERLKERDLLPHFAVVAEPTSVEKFGDMIKVGRRGSINGILKVFGKQGHVAYPKKCVNPVELIAPYLPKIAGWDLDNGSAEFEPSKLVVTDIRGGLEVVNVTPNDLKIMFNVRNSTKTSLEDLRQYLEGLLAKIPHSLELNQSSKPFLTNKTSEIVQRLVEVLESQNGFAPILSTSGGTSDARYLAEYGVSVVECGVCNDTIHSINERVCISEVESLCECFLALLCKWGA
ncbi:succinyl-diaminopimelate desuccinylase [Helicobacter sp. MIT 05-5294]|uniref:succinyl-diaminopimelate desuccinylase n=1 Tax=Helicobacter sp. MIT 05-5294 TaxID=1548150 RepID=UPI00051FC26D|nr:succinyl-diaminopimelate desuccinylase [Helicobacter sp. MIT 05-5294]TLD87788.1 succinyl-diaminopimelate desuccinylase [Helicobacter sp. MIT 05-5294]